MNALLKRLRRMGCSVGPRKSLPRESIDRIVAKRERVEREECIADLLRKLQRLPMPEIELISDLSDAVIKGSTSGSDGDTRCLQEMAG